MVKVWFVARQGSMRNGVFGLRRYQVMQASRQTSHSLKLAEPKGP